MDNILKQLKKVAKNDFAFTLDDKFNPYIVDEWIDTNCYVLNAALSDGDILKGMPVGKRIQLAGPSGVAKSLFVMYMIKSYLENKENSYVIIFESEGATVTEMARNYSVPEEKLIILPVSSVEEFKTQSVKMLDEIQNMQLSNKENPPSFLMVLDSLGMLGTKKEYDDAVSGSDKADMTRAKLIRSIFRLITLKLSLTKTTFIFTNHTGANIGGMSPLPVTGGGDGPKYSADVTLMLSKAKEKEGTKQVGAIITCRVDKSRYQPEGNKYKVILLFDKGIYKYSDLIDLGSEIGVLLKEGISIVFPDGQKAKRKTILNDPETYFNGSNLEKLQEAFKCEFGFGVKKLDFNISDIDDEDE